MRRVLAVVACAVALAACKVDIAVDVVVEPDGTGTITVIATADAEVVQAVPTIAEDLVIDDIVAAGWFVTGPTPTEDGGLAISFTHDFTSDQEATNLLRSLGPPFAQMAVQRGTTGDETTNQLNGLLGLEAGFESFADDDLIAAVGAVPFADELAASEATPETSMSARIRAVLPGEVVEENTNGVRQSDGSLLWEVPVDGTILNWRAETKQAPGDDRWWARPLSVAALIALIAWVAFMTLFIGFVAIARWRRARRYKRRHRGPSPDLPRMDVTGH